MFKLIIAAGLFAGIIYFITERLKYSPDKELKPKDSIGSYFMLKKYFFTQSEKAFYEELLKQNTNEYNILSKVRLEDIISAKSSLNWREKGIKRNYIKSKHIDFVILDRNYGNILAVIELDGKSHDTEKQGKYDRIKDDILNSVGLKFYRVRAGQDFSSIINSLFSDIKEA